MKSNLFFLLGFLLSSLLLGCAASTYVPQVKQADLPRLNLQYSVQEIEIIDSRKNQKTEDIQLPFVSKPGLLIKHEPALTVSHKEVLEKAIKENTTGSGPYIKAVIDITDGYKEFTSTWISENEKCFIHLQVTFIRKETGENFLKCDTGGELVVQSDDATNQRMEELYKLTLKNVLYNCLKSMVGEEKK